MNGPITYGQNVELVNDLTSVSGLVITKGTTVKFQGIHAGNADNIVLSHASNTFIAKWDDIEWEYEPDKPVEKEYTITGSRIKELVDIGVIPPETANRMFPGSIPKVQALPISMNKGTAIYVDGNKENGDAFSEIAASVITVNVAGNKSRFRSRGMLVSSKYDAHVIGEHGCQIIVFTDKGKKPIE